MAKSIPEVACGSHNNSRKQSDTAAEALSESEINAVMQLIQLSSADSYSYHTDHHQEDDDNSSNINNIFSFSFSKVEESGKSSVHVAASSSYSSSSSPPPPVAAVLSMEAEKGELAEEGNDGDDIDRNNLGERRNKRYRTIGELYRVTDETALMSVVKSNKRKKKKEKEMQQRAN